MDWWFGVQLPLSYIAENVTSSYPNLGVHASFIAMLVPCDTTDYSQQIHWGLLETQRSARQTVKCGDFNFNPARAGRALKRSDFITFAVCQLEFSGIFCSQILLQSHIAGGVRTIFSSSTYSLSFAQSTLRRYSCVTQDAKCEMRK